MTPSLIERLVDELKKSAYAVGNGPWTVVQFPIQRVAIELELSIDFVRRTIMRNGVQIVQQLPLGWKLSIADRHIQIDRVV